MKTIRIPIKGRTLTWVGYITQLCSRKKLSAILIAATILCGLTVHAQTNLSAVPNMMSTNWIDKEALSLGVPAESQLDLGAGASYVPSFRSGQRLGYWAAATYATATNSLLACEVGVFSMQLTPKQSTLLYPNGLLLIRKTWHLGSIGITPLGEVGAAIDGKFENAFCITGVGIGITWHHITLLGGAERWSGARESFTVAKIGAAYSINF